MLQTKSSGSPAPAAKAVHLRRLYTDCRFGQLHARSSFPSSGGFDEERALVCLHDAGCSSTLFRGVLAEFGRDRSVYAPDLPGSGESEVQAPPRSIEDYAAAIADFVDGLRVREFDLMAMRVGSQIAVEVALALPARVRHLVLVGVPCLSADERRGRAVQTALQLPREDGSQLVEDWKRLRANLGPTVSLDVLAAEFSERLRNRTGGAQLADAGLAHAIAERLMLVKQPALVLHAQDDLAEATLRGAALIPGARCMEFGRGPLPLQQIDPSLIRQLRAFLED